MSQDVDDANETLCRLKCGVEGVKREKGEGRMDWMHLSFGFDYSESVGQRIFSHAAKHKEEVVTLHTRRSIAEIAGTKTAD